MKIPPPIARFRSWLAVPIGPPPDSPPALRGPVRGRVLPLAYPNQAGARYPPSAPAGTLKGGIFMRRRVEVFIGPFGSGKTEVALNRGLLLAAEGSAVTLVDLDIVDPFFRARQVREVLARAGISVVAPEGEWEGADLPLLIPQVFGSLQRPGHIILDVGGEVQGAIILRQVRTLLPGDGGGFLVGEPVRGAGGETAGLPP